MQRCGSTVRHQLGGVPSTPLDPFPDDVLVRDSHLVLWPVQRFADGTVAVQGYLLPSQQPARIDLPDRFAPFGVELALGNQTLCIETTTHTIAGVDSLQVSWILRQARQLGPHPSTR
jgi:hypothetical protein